MQSDIIKHFTATLGAGESLGDADGALGDLPRLKGCAGAPGAFTSRSQQPFFLHTRVITAKPHTSGAKHFTLSLMLRALYVSCSSVNTDPKRRLSRLVVPLASPCHVVTRRPTSLPFETISTTLKICFPPPFVSLYRTKTTARIVLCFLFKCIFSVLYIFFYIFMLGFIYQHLNWFMFYHFLYAPLFFP